MGRRILVLVVGFATATVVTLSASAIPGAGERTSRSAGDTSSAGSVSTAVTNGSASPEHLADVANYWSPERMRSAKPAERTVPGGTQSPSTSPDPIPAPRVSPAPKTESAQKQPAKAKRSRSSTDAASGAVTSPETGTTAHWTQDNMDDAQPKDMTVPGGGDEAGPPDDGGGPVPVPATP